MKKESKVVASDPMHTLRHESTTLETLEDLAEFLESAAPSGEALVEEMADQLVNLLTADGWPNPFEFGLTGPNDEWRPNGSKSENLRWLRAGFKWESGARHIENCAEPLSETYFLARMAGVIDLIRQSRTKSEIISAASQLGRLEEQMVSRGVHLRKVKSWATRDDARKRGEAARAAANEERAAKALIQRRLAREIAQKSNRTKGALVSYVKRELAARGISVSGRTVRKYLR